MYRFSWVLTLAAGAAVGGMARASDPVGGYLTVDRVVLTPGKAPDTIQIWGSFVLATEDRGRTYGKPERGYLYYLAPKGMEEVCRKEWRDLRKAAGTAQVIGFGSSEDVKKLGKVRKGDRKPEAPDTYPLGNGLVRCDSDKDHPAVRDLLALPAPRTPAEGDLVPPGTVTLVTRNAADKKHAGARYTFGLTGSSGDGEEATVEAGEKETVWTPRLKLKGGATYTWYVRATKGEWKGPQAISRFVVKGGK